MIRIYFDKTLFAVFFDEHTYAIMKERLEILCKELGYSKCIKYEEYSIDTQEIVSKIESLHKD